MSILISWFLKQNLLSDRLIVQENLLEPELIYEFNYH